MGNKLNSITKQRRCKPNSEQTEVFGKLQQRERTTVFANKSWIASVSHIYSNREGKRQKEKKDVFDLP